MFTQKLSSELSMSAEFFTTKYTSTNIKSFEVALFLKILPFSAFFLCLTTFLGMNAHSAYVKKIYESFITLY